MKPQDLEKIALALPGVESAARSTSFRTATYRVAGKNFAAMEKRGSATFALDAIEVRKLTEREPDVFEPITRPGQSQPGGVRADISKISLRQLCQIVASAWQFKAPKKLSEDKQICSRGHVFTKTSEVASCPACWSGKD
ncbi:MAG: hypothetical protein ACREF5_03465 [Candidatus Saccharimonadales bacterium]